VPARNRSRANDLILLSLGATVGVVAGALLVDRVGGLDRLFRRRGATAPALDHDEGEEGGAPPYGLHDAVGGFDDDDHLHHDEHDHADHDDGTDGTIVDEPAGALAVNARARTDDTPDLLTLESRVLEAFHHDPVLRERAIDIGAIAPGVIELTGWVHAPEEVQHALTIARGIPDVQHVVDQLAVRQPRRNRRATDRLPVDLIDESDTSSTTRRAD
jgi:hypothetical protein